MILLKNISITPFSTGREILKPLDIPESLFLSSAAINLKLRSKGILSINYKMLNFGDDFYEKLLKSKQTWRNVFSSSLLLI
jgi:hypothetical protein